MAAYALDTLLQRWALHQITSEQAIGQILLLLQQIELRLLQLEKPPSTPPPPALVPPPPKPAPIRPPARKRASQGKVR